MKKKQVPGGKPIEDVKGVVAKIDGAGGTGSRAASERIVPVPQIDTYSELPFAPVEEADKPASRKSAPAARAKPKPEPKVGSSKPSKPRKRQISKSRKKRAAGK